VERLFRLELMFLLDANILVAKPKHFTLFQFCRFVDIPVAAAKPSGIFFFAAANSEMFTLQ
jgi:hypothetical protein